MPLCDLVLYLHFFSYKTSTSGRSLIRSHFGPLIQNSGMSEISLYLPNNIIYAIGLENFTMGTLQVLAILAEWGTNSPHPLIFYFCFYAYFRLG